MLDWGVVDATTHTSLRPGVTREPRCRASSTRIWTEVKVTPEAATRVSVDTFATASDWPLTVVLVGVLVSA